MSMRQGPPPDAHDSPDIDIPKVPTPQTDRQRVISRKDRFWWFVYNDPRGRILLISALIGTAYLIFRAIDAIALYSRIAQLAAPAIAAGAPASSALQMFFMELPVVHYVALLLAVIFNWVAFRTRRPWTALVSTLCYLLCAAFYIRWALFVVPELLLMIVGYMALVRRRGGWL